MRTKGKTDGKQRELRRLMFTSHQLWLYKSAMYPLKMKEKVWKARKADTKIRMIWVTPDSGEFLLETWVLWMCWTVCLCLYRMTIMDPLDQAMRTEKKTSGQTMSAAQSEVSITSYPKMEQYPKSGFLAIFWYPYWQMCTENKWNLLIWIANTWGRCVSRWPSQIWLYDPSNMISWDWWSRPERQSRGRWFHGQTPTKSLNVHQELAFKIIH